MPRARELRLPEARLVGLVPDDEVLDGRVSARQERHVLRVENRCVRILGDRLRLRGGHREDRANTAKSGEWDVEIELPLVRIVVGAAGSKPTEIRFSVIPSSPRLSRNQTLWSGYLPRSSATPVRSAADAPPVNVSAETSRAKRMARRCIRLLPRRAALLVFIIAFFVGVPSPHMGQRPGSSASSLPHDLENAHMRNAGGRGDLTQARALGMGFADRCTPSGVGLGATRRRPLYGCQGIGH